MIISRTLATYKGQRFNGSEQYQMMFRLPGAWRYEACSHGQDSFRHRRRWWVLAVDALRAPTSETLAFQGDPTRRDDSLYDFDGTREDAAARDKKLLCLSQATTWGRASTQTRLDELFARPHTLRTGVDRAHQ
jgi:hypothetical protein